MSQCPYCDAPLTSEELAGRLLDACPQCGGMWLGAADLAEVVKSHPELLAPFDDRYRDRGGRPPLDRPEPICARCHEPLTEKRFPNAPDVPVLACAACRMLFLKDGQLRQLHALASPNTLPPEPKPEPPPVLARADLAAVQPVEEEPLTGEWVRTRWPERADGQPWLSWAIVGMPLWAALVTLIIPLIYLMVKLSRLAPEELAEVPAGFTLLFAVMVMGLMWFVQALGMSIALRVVWWVYGGAGIGFLQTYRWMLPVVAVAMAATSLASLVCMGIGQWGMLYYILSMAIRVTLYRQVLELDWAEIWTLSLVSMFIGAGLGL